MHFKQSKIQIVQTDYQKTKMCINSIPLNIMNGKEQMNIPINITFSISYHITLTTVFKVNFVLLCFVLLCYLKMYSNTHAITHTTDNNHI